MIGKLSQISGRSRAGGAGVRGAALNTGKLAGMFRELQG